MRKQKAFFYVIIIFLIISMAINYYLYQDNNGLRSRIGTEYLLAVRDTLLHVDEKTLDFWVLELEKEHSEVQLERYIGKLRSLSYQFHRMNGKVSVLGSRLDAISDQLYELKKSIDNGEGIEVQKNMINNHVHFINKVLKSIEQNLGENTVSWFNELSNYDSKTSNEVWQQFKDFEKQN